MFRKHDPGRHVRISRFKIVGIPVFCHYIDELENKVKGLGVDPAGVPPSLDDPGVAGVPKRREVSATGKVWRMFYNCFGNFEGFELNDCNKDHHFRSCERSIEDLVFRACRERSLLKVIFDPESHRIYGIIVECACDR